MILLLMIRKIALLWIFISFNKWRMFNNINIGQNELFNDLSTINNETINNIID